MVIRQPLRMAPFSSTIFRVVNQASQTVVTDVGYLRFEGHETGFIGNTAQGNIGRDKHVRVFAAIMQQKCYRQGKLNATFAVNQRLRGIGGDKSKKQTLLVGGSEFNRGRLQQDDIDRIMSAIMQRKNDRLSCRHKEDGNQTNTHP